METNDFNFAQKIFMQILKEPVLFAGAIRAILLAVMAFGLEVSVEQLAAVMLALEVVLDFLTRAVSTPVVDPKPEEGFGI